MSARAYAACTDCGWTGGPYRSAAQADYARSRHSCTRHRARAEAAARRQARHDAVDRTPAPCHHKRVTHQHGTHATYTLDRCRCLPCSAAAAAYEQARVRRNAYGRSSLVDADPVRKHVRALMAASVGLKTITARTGVGAGVLCKLLYGVDGGATRPPARRVRKATAEKLLALDPADASLLAGGARVNATGTARRLQALVVAGWSVGALARLSGIDRQRLDRALAGRPVTIATVRAVTALYDRLWSTPPPEAIRGEKIAASSARRRARDAGWAPALAWDEDTIEDPTAVPDLGEPDPVVG